MPHKLFSYSALTAILFVAPTLLCAQTLGAGALQGIISGISGTLNPLGGEISGRLVKPLQATTASLGLNSSPLFNVLPGNPLVITYGLLLQGPEEAILVNDLLEGDLIIKGLLSGLPGGDTIRATYQNNLKELLPTPSLANGLIDSQL
ncbi:hypothetical protein [Zhongshania sp.]|uniref:hypothetical protein n=1 Tax=Zhongshania sp. TaxID=1971902 RepID=UPI0035633639